MPTKFFASFCAPNATFNLIFDCENPIEETSKKEGRNSPSEALREVKGKVLKKLWDAR